MSETVGSTMSKIQGDKAGRAAQFCYLAFLFIMTALKALGFFEGQRLFTLFMVAACLLLLLKIILTDHSCLEFPVILLFLGMGGLVYLNTGEKGLLLNLMMVVGIKGVSTKRAMKVFLSVWSVCYLLLITLSLTGLHSDKLFMHNKHVIGEILCHSLGYSHSNVLHINYLCICGMILYLAADHFSKHQKLILLAILTALDLYIFLYSVSFTGLIGAFVMYLIYLYMTLRGSLGRSERLLAQSILPLCLIFSLIGPLVIRGRLFDLIDSALNTRYSLTQWFMTNQSITLFGSRLESPEPVYYTLDCSYAYLFIQLGVVPFIVLMLLYIGMIHRFVEENRLSELAIVLGLCIAGIAEPFLFNLGFKNFTFLFVGEYLYDLLDRLSSVLKSRSGRELRPCRILPVGDGGQAFELLPRLCAGVCHIGNEILQIWFRCGKRYLLTAAAAGLLFGCAASVILEPGECLYIGVSVSADDPYEREDLWLSEEDIELLREEGNYVYEYNGEYEPMYVYTGTAPAYEYWRMVISCGVYGAAAVCCIGALWERRRRRCSTGITP